MALTVIVLVSCTGCGTVISGLSQPYSGVRMDANLVSEGGWGLVWALDVPMSCAADTLFLPIGLHNLTLMPPKVDPLAGWNSWHESDEDSPPVVQKTHAAKHPPLDKAIKDDYQSYLNKHEAGYFVSTLSLTFHEDGNGNHAVSIQIGRNGRYWVYIFIYDKDNVRTKIIRYISGAYAC